jgi:hypothetical protein
MMDRLNRILPASAVMEEHELEWPVLGKTVRLHSLSSSSPSLSQGSHCSWNSWKTPGILKNFFQGPRKLLENIFLNFY